MALITDSRTRNLILALFFLSGACTLVYELVWVRMLVLVFGTSVFAVSTVLSAFMAGLALGSALFGRLVDRSGNALKIYAWLEAGIGLFALAFPFILAGLDDLYTVLYRLLEGQPYLFSLVRFVICFLVLLVPTTLMGATLPVLSKFVVQRLAAVGRRVGALYAFNTFGAMAGCLVTAFFLMELAGVRGSTWVAAAGNILIAAVAFVLSARVRDAGPRPEGARRPAPEAAVSPEPVEGAPPAYMTRLVFWGFALSGFTALGYEVVWSRLLSVVLRLTTSQSLSTILISFLFGLALGGAIGARWADRWKRLFSVFGAAELALGLFGLASLAVFAAIPRMVQALNFATWWGHMAKLFLVAFGVMLVPTILMGLLFPVVGKIHVLGLGSLGRKIGNVYAANTTGAIFGAFTAGFVLIPLIGTQGSLEVLAWINVAVGAAVLLLDPGLRPRTRVAVAAGLALPVLLLTLLLPSDFMSELFERAQPRAELLYYDEAVGGTVTVYEFPGGHRVLRVNGAGEVPTDRASIQIFRLLGNLPLALHPDPREVLVIAFGGGITLSSVELQRPQRVDCVEIVPGVFEAARWFEKYNNGVFERLDQPWLDLIVDDGRNHVLRSRREYDVIISDSTHPGTADSWVLYTEEFYRLCRERLKSGGLFAQWLPLHGLTEDGYRMILRTFHEVFPHASLWVTEDYSVMLGAPDGLAIDLRLLEERLGRPEVRASLAEVDLDEPFSFLANLTLDERAFAAYAGEGRTNTDNRPWISFASRMRSGGAGGMPVSLSLIPHLDIRADSVLVGADAADIATLQRRLRARARTRRGLAAFMLRDGQQALDELRQALALAPEDPEAQRALRRVQRGR